MRQFTSQYKVLSQWRGVGVGVRRVKKAARKW